MEQEFIQYALRKGYRFNDVMEFMPYFENLNSFGDNLKKLEKRLENDR